MTKEAEQRLVHLLDQTMHEAQASPADTILSIPTYDAQKLRNMLDTSHQTTMSKYQAYIARRRARGPRELFRDAEYAKQWLKYAAVVKYVDGGWIGAIVNSLPVSQQRPFLRDTSLERTCGKIAWQVISEEFGDGDLTKNHVYLYERLIASLRLGSHTSPTSHLGYEPGFDGTADDAGVPNCWAAAVAQQCIGLLAAPEDYFPEALGFNMAYETLPYHLLVTSYELRELKIDDYYFNIHITIDNPSTGHSAMARIAVEQYIEGVRARDGEQAAQIAWRRVQAGFILAEGLPTTPTKPKDVPYPSTNVSAPVPVPEPTSAFAALIVNKAASSNKIHCASRLRLGGKTVEQWLDTTESSMTYQRAVDFANVLGEKTGWVEPGRPEQSRFVAELEWGGRMFGAFSRSEVDIVRGWIRSLPENKLTELDGAYARYIRNTASKSSDLSESALLPSNRLHATSSPLTSLLALWLLSLTLFDHFQLSPSRFASPLGMIVLRIQRAQLGFIALHRPEDICEGNDPAQSLGFENGIWEIASRMWAGATGSTPGRDLREIAKLVGKIDADLVDRLLDYRSRPYAYAATLLGLAEGFLALPSSPFVRDQLRDTEMSTTAQITKDELEALNEWKERIASQDESREFEAGRQMALQAIGQASIE